VIWTFECPPGGTFTAAVDTKDDTDTGTSQIDPFLEAFSGSGRLIASGDEEFACANPPVCGFRCPQIRQASCSSNPNSLLVRDFGDAEITGVHCALGGGYVLFLQVFTSDGAPVPAEQVQLGGGATRRGAQRPSGRPSIMRPCPGDRTTRSRSEGKEPCGAWPVALFCKARPRHHQPREDFDVDTIEHLRQRWEALEHQTAALAGQTRAVEQRLRWWRGLACGVVVLSLLSLALLTCTPLALHLTPWCQGTFTREYSTA